MNIEDEYRFNKGISRKSGGGILSKNQIKGILRKSDIMPFIDIRSREILIVGMGYVGLTLALVLADNNFSVIGYDNNKKLILSDSRLYR